MRRFTRATLLTGAVAIAFAACGDDSTGPVDSEPTTLSIVAGDGQTLAAGGTSTALTVRVVDQNDDAMEGVSVTFTGSGAEHTLSGQSATTGSNGQAGVTVTAGAAAGTIEVEAAVSGLDPVTFTLTVQVDEGPAAASITIVSGETQSLDLEQASEPLVVEVLDENDEPIEGSLVTFAGSGVAHTLSAGTATTDADGRAEITATAGTEEGDITVAASVAGLDAVTFTLSVEDVSAAASISIVSGDAQALQYNDTSAALVVEVLNQDDNPVEGLTVAFATATPGHALSAATATTGADGRAEITVIVGIEPGDIEVEATVGELTPVVFTLTVADDPHSVTVPDNVRGVTYDGTWLWAVADLDPNPVIYKIDPKTGAVEDSFDAPAPNHRGLAWGDDALWYSSGDGDIYKVDPSNGDVLDDFESPGFDNVGDQVRGLTWADGFLWHNAITGGVATVYKILPEFGVSVDDIPNPVDDPLGLAWDGTHFWTTQHDADTPADRTLVRFDTDGVEVDEIPNPGARPIGITHDAAGPYLWVADGDDDVIRRIKLTP